jgi:outer membrane protein
MYLGTNEALAMKTAKRGKYWTGFGFHKGMVCFWTSIGLVWLAVAGCPAPTLKEDLKIKALTTNLNTIEAVRPADLSDSPPISVEEASKEVTEQVTDSNEEAPVIELTLDQVRAATLENNLDLKVDLIDPAVAQRSLDIERAKFEATFYGSASYTTSETDAGVSSTSNDYDMGVRAPLYTGGSISVGMPFGESDGDTFDGVADAAVSVSVIQSLLRGGGMRINTQSIRIAGYEKHAVDARTKQRAIDLLVNADITYWNLYTALRDLDVSREQYKLAQDQLNHAQKKVAAGAAPRTEIIRAESGLLSRVGSLIDTETRVQNRQLDLQRIMNRPDMPLNANIRIDPKTVPNPLKLDVKPEKLIKIALDNRMETIQWELALAIEELNLEITRNAVLPDLSLSYTYNTATDAGDIGHALEAFGDRTSDAHSLGLSASIPLGNRAAKARLERARLQQLQNQISYADFRLSIRKEVYDAVRELNNSWRSILAAEKDVEAALRTYKVEQSQFEIGNRTSTEVLDSATALAGAQLGRIHAIVEYEIAQIYLARATGTLLGHSRIILEPTDLPDSGGARQTIQRFRPSRP